MDGGEVKSVRQTNFAQGIAPLHSKLDGFRRPHIRLRFGGQVGIPRENEIQTFQFGLFPALDETFGEVNVAEVSLYLPENIDAFHDGREKHVVIREIHFPVFVSRPHRPLMIQRFECPRIVSKKFHAFVVFQRQEFAVGVEYVAKRVHGGTSKNETIDSQRAI